MVLPDGSGANDSRPGKGRASLFVLAGLVIVAGFMVLGSLTPSDPIAIEETTTTTPNDTTTTIEDVPPPIDPDNFSVGQVARGEPLDWEPAMILDDSQPMALFDHEGWIYLFSTKAPNFSSFDEGGLRGWRTTDGSSWEPLGQVIPEADVISSVASAGRGLVALGAEPTESGFVIWRSVDGVTWHDEEVPVEIDNPYLGAVPIAVGGTDDLLVVAGSIEVLASRLADGRLGEAIADNLEIAAYGWSTDYTGDDVEFNLYGPLGFPLVSVSADELGLTAEEREMLARSLTGRQTQNIVWVKQGDEGWQQVSLTSVAHIESVATTPEEEILVLGWGPNGFTRWTSEDGLDWKPAVHVVGPRLIDEWGETLVGPTSTGAPSVVVGVDDGWDEIGPRELFPEPFEWSLGPTAAGRGGVATMVYGWMNNSRMAPPPDPVTLTSGNTTLTLDFNGGRYTLDTGGDTHSWSMAEATPEGLTVDLETGAVVFEDPVSAEPLASFPLEDITDAQNTYWSDWSFSLPHQAFAFTADGLDWTIQDQATIGDDIDIRFLEVTDSSVIAVGVNNAGMYNATLSPGFGVWSAPIP